MHFARKRHSFLTLTILLLVLSAGMKTNATDAKSGMIVRREGACRLLMPKANEAIRRRLGPVCIDSVKKIYSQLGAPTPAMPPEPAHIEVRVVSRPSDFALHSPEGAVLPDWTGAVAFPRHGRILIPLFHADGRPHTDLEVTLMHELSHLAFYDAAGPVRAPRWFTEGIAILQSEGSPMHRRGAIWWASLLNRIHSLKEIERYPQSDLRARQAYAQGAEFVAFLIDEKGWEGIRQVLRRLESESFDLAFRQVYGEPLRAVENRWRTQLFGSTEWLMTVTSDTVFLGAAALLCLLAFVIIRRRYHRQLGEMEKEEQAIRQLIAAMEEQSDDPGDPSSSNTESRTVLH